MTVVEEAIIRVDAITTMVDMLVKNELPGAVSLENVLSELKYLSAFLSDQGEPAE